ncbi:hypothetical protein ZYGR_0N04510 [Zygosaccharomyces rouxii]|uniref:ATP synthase F(0) complex subunit e, mitochondrial n=2 Tax=Zygosaccharomyces rouxii TaxID=4956 RepID=C5DVZ5_ZYGRC|nr:uncharacterized protein ZYRO0D10626g [Zygosaccharomyces rouxii]KAH9200873.1 hypothetical protein LQ764DRAFT_234059 [Zygosaccharomyces rouxii]GAV49046.1 hypothetical protein ZYGR_0N04510 [Zygosaccharomyces rouxii]CAR27964.1 ZYRO0D10626p [Zygosaccharomyces rouxii]
MSTANVLRYSALGLGVFFGLKNDMGNKKTASQKAADDAFQAKLKLVDEARAEYGRLHNPAPTTQSKEINLEDPNLDIGAAILQAVDSLGSN